MRYLLEQPCFTQLEIPPLALSHTATLCSSVSFGAGAFLRPETSGLRAMSSTKNRILFSARTDAAQALSLPLLRGCLRGAVATPVCQGGLPPAQEDAVLPLSPLRRQTVGDWARGERGLWLPPRPLSKWLCWKGARGGRRTRGRSAAPL